MIKNPILPGFHPDPSIIRVEDDFYLVTSSFSYFPGIPIFHSTNLSDWEQIGYVLDRPKQLQVTYEKISGGIFAPTIRYHDGVFYVIVTNATKGGINFVVTAEDPRGPWSDIHVIEGAVGIDPSLFFDDDGTVYYTGTATYGEESGVWGAPVDLETFQLAGERKVLWKGALEGAASPEGPHIYKKDGYYYLMIAEGGTEHYHAVTISRSTDPMGPYVGYEGNPILTHRHLGTLYPICNVGHGDMVELKDGSWYMAVLASRLMDGYHKLMGRETFLVPVVWENGWPVVSPGTGKVEMQYPQPAGLEATGENEKKTDLLDDFDGDRLGLEWNFLGTPYEQYTKLEDSCLNIRVMKRHIVPWDLHGIPNDMISLYVRFGKTKECVGFVGRRQEHRCFEAWIKMDFCPEEEERAGLVIIQNQANQLRLECGMDENGAPQIRCMETTLYAEDGKQYYRERCLGSMTKPAGETSDAWYLKVRGIRTKFDFFAGADMPKDGGDEENWIPIAQNVDGSFLGSETCGGYVGTYIGMFTGNGSEEKEHYASFDWFGYREIEEEQ